MDTVPRDSLFRLQGRDQRGNNLRLFFCVFIAFPSFFLASGSFLRILSYYSRYLNGIVLPPAGVKE